MNIINRFFLKIVLMPMPLYSKWGINTIHLEAILTAKLLMDDRRTNAFSLLKQKTKKDSVPTRSTLVTMLISLVMGLVFLFTFAFGDDFITQLTFYFSFFIFMLASTLISDFTSVLIDVRDTLIILPKPVSDRTFVTARLLHILIHLSKVILPMAIPGFVLMIYLAGWGALIFFVLIMLSALLTIFIINAVYLLILKITTPARFRNIISYIQIFFAIFIYAAFQLLPRLMGRPGMEHFSIRNYDWIIAFPSYWFAAAFETLYVFDANYKEIAGTIIAFVFPFLSIYLVIKYLAPAFNQKLAMISGGDNAVATKKIIQEKRSISERLSKLFTRGNIEATGFLLAWKISSRSRDFKVKTYPGIGYMVVIMVMMAMNMKDVRWNDLRGTTGIGMITIAVYIASFLPLIAIGNMTMSEKYKAAWIYYTAPVEKPGQIISGAIKSMLVKFFLPLVIIVAISAVIVSGIKVLPNLALALANQLVIVYMLVLMGKKQLPFSSQLTMDQQSGNFIRVMGRLMVISAIGFIHYMVKDHVVLVYVATALSIATTVTMMKQLKYLGWNKIMVQEAG